MPKKQFKGYKLHNKNNRAVYCYKDLEKMIKLYHRESINKKQRWKAIGYLCTECNTFAYLSEIEIKKPKNKKEISLYDNRKIASKYKKYGYLENRVKNLKPIEVKKLEKFLNDIERGANKND